MASSVQEAPSAVGASPKAPSDAPAAPSASASLSASSSTSSSAEGTDVFAAMHALRAATPAAASSSSASAAAASAAADATSSAADAADLSLLSAAPFLTQAASGAAGVVERPEVRIVGTGRHVPGPPVDNAEVLGFCDLPSSVTLGWVTDRVGIRTRHIARELPPQAAAQPAPGRHNSDLGVAAVRQALAMCGKEAKELELLVVATCTPDFPVPSTATLVQDKLGVPEMAAMDVRSACAGSTQALITALNFLQNGTYRVAAVVGSELGTVFGDLFLGPEAPKMECVNVVMMGDGAGCAILEAFDKKAAAAARARPENNGDLPGMEIAFTRMNSIGAGKSPGMWLPAGGSSHPCHQGTIDKGLNTFKHDFREVLAHGPELYYRGLKDTLDQLNYAFDDIDCFVPHQANGRVPDLGAKMGIVKDRIYFNFDRVGNTANASLLICLDEIVRGETTDGSDQTMRLWPGANVLLLAAESTKWLYGATLIKYKPASAMGGPVAAARLRAAGGDLVAAGIAPASSATEGSSSSSSSASSAPSGRRHMTFFQRMYGAFVMKFLGLAIGLKRVLRLGA